MIKLCNFLVCFLIMVSFLSGCAAPETIPLVQPATSISPSQTPNPTVLPTDDPTQWESKTILEDGSDFSNSNPSANYNGREVDGSGVYVNQDTRWKIHIKLEQLPGGSQIESTGLVISGETADQNNSSIFLGYTESHWVLFYAPETPEQETYQTSFSSLTDLEEEFILSISSEGKELKLFNGVNELCSKTFSTPLFPNSIEVSAYTQNGPYSKVSFSSLKIIKKTLGEYSNLDLSSTSDDQGGQYHDFKSVISNQNPNLGEVLSVAFSPDGKTVTAGTENGSVDIFDVNTLATLFTLSGFHSGIRSVSFSPDGSMLATGSWDKTTALWDTQTGTRLQTLTLHTDPVLSTAFSQDGKLVATGSVDKRVFLWDTATGKKVRTLVGHTLDVNCITFSPDGTLIATASTDKTIILWDAVTLTKIKTLEGHTNSVYWAAFSPDSKTLASASWDGRVLLWDVATDEIIATLNCEDKVWSVAYSPDGKLLASASWNGTIIIWDAATHEKMQEIHTSEQLTSIAFSPDGHALFSGAKDNLTVWRND